MHHASKRPGKSTTPWDRCGALPTSPVSSVLHFYSIKTCRATDQICQKLQFFLNKFLKQIIKIF